MADFSPTIGSLFGIKIELHWTFILLLLFILFLSLYFFLLWVMLFVCVLAHELIHSITSKINKIKVSKIVLYPFGGGSIIDFENVTPAIEFRISIVGPIASLLLAVFFGIINIYTPAGIVRVTIQTLFVLNLFLGVFNLLPWLPLDGGRALRSYLQRTRSFLDATKIAVKSSNLITVLFVAGTIAYAVLAHGYTILYREFIVIVDVMIALFIYSGARYELQSAFIKENITELKASNAMTKNYVVVSGDMDTEQLYSTMMKKRAGIVIFKRNGNIEMISNNSLQKLMKNPSYKGKIENFGTPIMSIEYNTKLYSAIERMRSEGTGIAAVTKHGSVVGILLPQHAESVIALHISKKARSPKGGQRNK